MEVGFSPLPSNVFRGCAIECYFSYQFWWSTLKQYKMKRNFTTKFVVFCFSSFLIFNKIKLLFNTHLQPKPTSAFGFFRCLLEMIVSCFRSPGSIFFPNINGLI